MSTIHDICSHNTFVFIHRGIQNKGTAITLVANMFTLYVISIQT